MDVNTKIVKLFISILKRFDLDYAQLEDTNLSHKEKHDCWKLYYKLQGMITKVVEDIPGKQQKQFYALVENVFEANDPPLLFLKVS